MVLPPIAVVAITYFVLPMFGVKQGVTLALAGGAIGGALIGYNFQSGHFVYGGEASIDLNVVRGTVPGQPGLNASRVDTLDDVRLRGILGYEFGWWMPFVAGGAVILSATLVNAWKRSPAAPPCATTGVG